MQITRIRRVRPFLIAVLASVTAVALAALPARLVAAPQSSAPNAHPKPSQAETGQSSGAAHGSGSGGTGKTASAGQNSLSKAELTHLGAHVYRQAHCFVCHGQVGYGTAGPRFRKDKALMITGHVVQQILVGRGIMPAFADKLNDTEIAAVATFIRTSWGNSFGPVQPHQVATMRQKVKTSQTANHGSGKSSGKSPKNGSSDNTAGESGSKPSAGSSSGASGASSQPARTSSGAEGGSNGSASKPPPAGGSSSD